MRYAVLTQWGKIKFRDAAHVVAWLEAFRDTTDIRGFEKDGQQVPEIVIQYCWLLEAQEACNG